MTITAEVAPGLLVVFYPDGTVEIASNHELPGSEGNPHYGGPGNVFMPLHLFTRLQDYDFPRAYPKLQRFPLLSKWRTSFEFWWKFSRVRFYLCLLIHRKVRRLPGGVLESACEKCYLQNNDGLLSEPIGRTAPVQK